MKFDNRAKNHAIQAMNAQLAMENLKTTLELDPSAEIDAWGNITMVVDDIEAAKQKLKSAVEECMPCNHT